MAPKKPRIIRPEDEDRRTDSPANTDQVNSPPPKRDDEKRKAREAGVESLPDGEAAATEEASKARDD